MKVLFAFLIALNICTAAFADEVVKNQSLVKTVVTSLASFLQTYEDDLYYLEPTLENTLFQSGNEKSKKCVITTDVSARAYDQEDGDPVESKNFYANCTVSMKKISSEKWKTTDISCESYE